MSLEKFQYKEGERINFSKVDTFQEYLKPDVIQAMEENFGKPESEELINTINILATELYSIIKTLRSDKDVQRIYTYDPENGVFCNKNNPSGHALHMPQVWFPTFVKSINEKQKNKITKEDLEIFQRIKSDLESDIRRGRRFINNMKEKGVFGSLAEYGLDKPLSQMSPEYEKGARIGFDEAVREAKSRDAAHSDPFFKDLEKQMEDFNEDENGGDKNRN